MLSIRIFGTQVKAKASAVPLLVAVWGVVVWLGQRAHPGRKLGKGMLVGLLSASVLLLAEIGHAFAHIFSARLARAPMDELLISAGMPRTLYWNNDVSPDSHRLRATGGLMYNAVGFLLSAIGYKFLPRDSVARELCGWSSFGHGFLIVASLAPVPPVDGGSLLKWTLVSKGKTPGEADEIIRRVDWGMAAAAAIAGTALSAKGKRLPGLALMGAAGAVAAIAAGKIR